MRQRRPHRAARGGRWVGSIVWFVGRVSARPGWPLTSAGDQRLTTSHLAGSAHEGAGLESGRGPGCGVTHGRLPHHREHRRWQIKGMAALGRVPHLPQTRGPCEGVGTLRFPAGCPGVCGPNPSTGLDEQLRYCDAVEPRQDRGSKKFGGAGLPLRRRVFSVSGCGPGGSRSVHDQASEPRPSCWPAPPATMSRACSAAASRSSS